ncbi:MAG: acyl-CoA thioester hydrolase [Planctomycetota bacterium]|nr:MAG: acyl-CoA thioester hydrolase [Planctomycetota bacterium]
MPAVFELRRTVQPHEIDDQGHVGNVEYLRWLQDAAVEHSAAQGWPKERYLEFGAVFVVRSHQIEYLQPAFAGDEVKVVTWVNSFHKFTTVRKYQVIRERDSLLLAKAATNWAFISWPNRLPKRFPPELVAAFVQVSEDQEPSSSPGNRVRSA